MALILYSLLRLGNAPMLKLEGIVIIKDAIVSQNGGRHSGGIVLLHKNIFHDWISIVKTSPNFLWFTINKRYTKATKDVYVCGFYIPPSSSKYFDPELIEQLEKDVLTSPRTTEHIKLL